MLLLVVEVVEPSLAAMLRGFEDGAIRIIEQRFGDFIPSPILFALHCLHQSFVLFFGPGDFLGGLDHIEQLKVQELGILVEEGGGESVPLLGGLLKCICTILLEEISLK